MRSTRFDGWRARWDSSASPAALAPPASPPHSAPAAAPWRRWLLRHRRLWVHAAALLLATLGVQATVVTSTRAALYVESDYLIFPQRWLDTIQLQHPVRPPLLQPDASPATGGSALDPLPLDIKLYRVRRGDTLSDIAERFGLNLDTVASLNRTAGVGVHMLTIGELIKVPNQDGIYLTAGADFETLSLSKGVLPEAVLATNGVTREQIDQRTELFFPGVQHTGRELSLVTGAAFARPTRGWISSGFGLRIDPFTGTRRFHRGVDIAALRGTRVLASQDGRIAAVGDSVHLGHYIIVSHFIERYSTIYGHLDRVLVSRGQVVERGQAIGTVGSSGRATGPHLHFEIRRGNSAQDPAQLIPRLR